MGSSEVDGVAQAATAITPSQRSTTLKDLAYLGRKTLSLDPRFKIQPVNNSNGKAMLFQIKNGNCPVDVAGKGSAIFGDVKLKREMLSEIERRLEIWSPKFELTSSAAEDIYEIVISYFSAEGLAHKL